VPRAALPFPRRVCLDMAGKTGLPWLLPAGPEWPKTADLFDFGTGMRSLMQEIHTLTDN